MTRVSRLIQCMFLRYFLLALSAFVGLYLLVDLFEKLDNFSEASTPALTVLGYFASRVPTIVTQVAPMAVLLATFSTLGNLSRTNELLALRSIGLSLQRISRPLLLWGLLIASGLLAMTEHLTPLASRLSVDLWETAMDQGSQSRLSRQNLWLRDGQSIYFIRLVAPESGQLLDVRLYQLDDNFQLSAVVQGKIARYEEGRWAMGVDQFWGDTETPNTKLKLAISLPLRLSPEDFSQQNRSTEELRLSELRDLMAQMQQQGLQPTRLAVDHQSRLAQPFTCLVMAFLGIPFSLQRGREHSLAIGVALSVTIGISYFFLQALTLSVGYTGSLPPLMAAWAPNLIFLLLGTGLLLSRRT